MDTLTKKILLFSYLLFLTINFKQHICAQSLINSSERPNIIFILTDDQRWDAIGASGNEIIKTPEMDKLADEGTYFRNAIVTTPICAASRASIFSGVHERTHRYTFQTGGMLNEFMEESYPKLLKDAGYYTGFFGKFGVNYNNKESLFDEIEDYDRNNSFSDKRGYFYKVLNGDTVHLTRYTGQKALDFLDETPSDKPFCLSLSFSAPHAHDRAELQYFWQEEPSKLFNNEDMPPAQLSDDEWFEKLPQDVRNGFNRTRWNWRYDTPEKYQHSVKGYYRMIYGIDLEIAKIRQKLKEKGLDKNTVIMLMGDNGYFLGERQLAGKWLMYDNSVRVPLIVYDPRVNNSQKIDEMALNLDVPATMLDLAGVKKPKSWQGKSLASVVSGKQKSVQRDTILIEHLWEFENIPPSEGVRTAEWKYLRYVNDKSIEELYNIKKDPQETKNLVDKSKYAKVLNELRNKTDEITVRFAGKFSGAPTGLTVETIRDPRFTRIVDEKPELSWIIPQEAGYQKAFQVLVSSSKELIDKNIGDVWNSGRVASNNSILNEIEKPLKANTTYFWKVRFYDKNNRLSEYSEPQKFVTGSFDGKITSHNYFQVEKIEPVNIKNTSSGIFADFGKAAFATLEINYKTEKAKTITIRLGEKLLDGKVDRNPGGTIRYQEVKLDLTPEKTNYQIELVPDERNTKSVAVALPDSFPIILPYRYVEIDGIEDLKAENINQVAYFNYFENNTSYFTSSDDILNQVWDLCKYSMKATSFAGYYVDGDRERIPYEADAYLNQLTHYSVDNEYAIARKTIEYFMDFPTWPTEWQLHVALMFYEDYMYTGNTELIEKYYEPLKHKTLIALENEEGFVSTHSPKLNGEVMASLGFNDTTQRLRDIVDWPPGQKDTGWKLPKDWPQGERDGFIFKPINTVINSLYYKNMVIMAEFARILNKPEEELDFQLRAAKVKKAINDRLLNKETGYYRDGIGTDHGSVHANMMPLAFDIVPNEYKKSVVEHIKTRGMGCSVYGAQYLMEAIYNAGADDYALELMTATHDRSWYNMIKIGSTITLEAWDMKYKPNSDWNHAWGAAPGNIIPRWLWGIQPKTPGFSIVKINPQMGNLKNTSIKVPTIRGEIDCDYKKVNKRLSEYTIELPANMVGEFIIDSSSNSVVSLNGEEINPLFGKVNLYPGKNIITMKINSF